MDNIVFGVCMLLAFMLGAYTKSDKKIKTLNPVKIVKEKVEINRLEKEQEKEQEKYRIIAENIDNYDGTSRGQQDVPR